MTTPKTLNTFRLDRGWTVTRLSDEIWRVTNIRISPRTVERFCSGEYEPREITRHAIEKFMRAQVDGAQESVR